MRSCGNAWRSARTTVSPPIPESYTPRGASPRPVKAPLSLTWSLRLRRARRQYTSTLSILTGSSFSRPFRNGELDDERVGDDRPALAMDRIRRRLGRPAGREKIVDHNDARLLAERCLVHLELGNAVLGLVRDAVGLRRELAGLARRDEAGVEPRREGAAEDEAARLDADDRVDVLADEALGERVEHDVQRPRVGEQRRDVLEQDPRLRESRGRRG